MSDDFLHSARLSFRRWRESDFSLALALWSDPAVARYISAQPLSAEQVRERLQREIETQTTHGIQYWPIFRLGSGEHVGCCGLRPRPGQTDVPELGVHIAARHWRNGYAFEAAASVIERAFQSRACSALYAGHHPRNDASRQLLLRLGFVHTHDEFYAPTGLEHPSYLLRCPWP